MKTIHIRYFALLQEQSGKEAEWLTTDLKSYSELYQFLAHQYNFSLNLNQIKVAVNNQFSRPDAVITDQAEVVFIPPVSGG